ncbi:YidC/Oxa1 family membrane protein insertase [Micromonospora sagamiensis]|uniref:Membrane protein insertase YidC n=1 Tax=Micromonospora sagamiensis TaxID=47875 RepID=A0A562WAZ0_9ACTN|nr:membrane protein insertase YidC [Micromonospora sagamiensis]TWJ27402.1 YidC/Oxa1 family membrane protein insertase [Micromonospora sagamiensis]BCL13707.1 membrane protein [Micromonospora sagamiensis]
MLAFAPLDAAVDVASHAVSALATALAPLSGGAATAVAIVGFTVAVRLLIAPLTVAQVRGERRRAALAPQVGELRRRYADDPVRLQRELLDLYRSAGASPLAGCLPALLQAPFFLVMYRLFTAGDQSPLTGWLVGVPLGHELGDGLAGAAGPVWGVLLAALLALAWLASRRMRRTMAAGSASSGGSSASAGPVSSGGPASSGGPVSSGGPAAVGGVAGDLGATVGRILPLLPYATLPVALVVPLAGVLYLVTTTAFTALEHTVLRRGRPTSPPTLDRNS